VRDHGNLDVWFAGMVGSRNGWRETPYVRAPADSRALAASVLRFEVQGLRIAIVPGLSCTNPFGAPDLMRGEETQIVGALVAHPHLAVGRKIVALPGTHTKWAVLEDGRIATFHTALTGEMYSLLKDHSMLARASNAVSLAASEATDAGRKGFELGLARARELNSVPLTHLLFEARSRQITGEWSQREALGYLSGLLIAQDVEGALRLVESQRASVDTVTVVGASDLADLYARALAAHSVEASIIDASEATILGLHSLMHATDDTQATHAATP
jgi:2-dehydro-3-deoxygalactonokinase